MKPQSHPQHSRPQHPRPLHLRPLHLRPLHLRPLHPRPQHPRRHTGESRYPLWALIFNCGIDAAFDAVDPGFRRDDGL